MSEIAAAAAAANDERVAVAAVARFAVPLRADSACAGPLRTTPRRVYCSWKKYGSYAEPPDDDVADRARSRLADFPITTGCEPRDARKTFRYDDRSSTREPDEDEEASGRADCRPSCRSPL